MTSYERMMGFLKREPIDRIPVYEHFWGDTIKSYIRGGFIKEDEDITEHFHFDMEECWAFSMVADLDFHNEIVTEDEDTVTVKDGNGAILRRHKKHDTTPEHVDFTVKTREQWEKIKPMLTKVDRRRINFERYRTMKKNCREKNRFFVWSGINVFELIHPVCGHENMLVAMALDPEFFADMAETYANLSIELQKILFAEEGPPDGIWYYEDMGFKQRPFMSPDMYCDLVQPSHKKTFDYAHSLDLPVIVHSCGFVEPLLPHMIQAGMDCLQVIEVKAGMDLLRIYENYGDKISLMGGIDDRCLYSNDRDVIDKELTAKIPVVKKNFGYALHSDHSIPETVTYDTLAYFFKKGLELGEY